MLNVLITGGSQGSRTLNQAARQSWPLFRKAGFPVRIVHQTGPNGHEELRDEFAQIGPRGRNGALHHRHAGGFRRGRPGGLPVGRGRGSELAAAGKPSILVPFPFAADDHQTRNAEAMERGGAARLVRDAE